MSTTNLFVELVVIGVGAAIWIVLLGLAVIGCEWATDIEAVSLVAIVPTLAVVYVLGIVSDGLTTMRKAERYGGFSSSSVLSVSKGVFHPTRTSCGKKAE